METDTPSSTARLVLAALLLLYETKGLRDTVPGFYQTVFRNHRRVVEESVGGYSLFTKPWSRWAAWCLERWFVPGLFQHFALRKQAIAALAQGEIVRGARQIVVVGAGLDLLGSSLLEAHPETTVIEVDHPATQQLKRLLLNRSSLASPTLVPADLAATPLHEALSVVPSFNRASPTLFIAEGLTMYLSESAVRSLLLSGFRLGAASHGWIFTCMTHRVGMGFGFVAQSKLTGAWLNRQNERFTWGVAKEELPGFLATLGLNGQIIESAPAESSAARGESIVFVPRAPLSDSGKGG